VVQKKNNFFFAVPVCYAQLLLVMQPIHLVMFPLSTLIFCSAQFFYVTP